MTLAQVYRLGRALLIIAVIGTSQAWSQAVTTYHFDNFRTGWNPNEAILTPTVVRGSSFGLRQSVPLDDQVDNQPLYVPAVNITAGQDQGTHDVAFVATENNTVYAIDAESGTVLLSPNFGPPIPHPLNCTNSANVGINSTPVIDASSNTLYVMVYTQQNNAPAYLLHALDLGSLTDKVPPQLVTASHTLANGSTVNFNAKYQRQRPGLLLANGSVYAGFGSFCDFAPNLSRGWLLGWQTDTLTPLAANQIFDARANSPDSFFLSSIWMSGYGPAADDSGNILVVTGNSDPAGTTYDGVNNLQESVVKISPDLSIVLDLFTPLDWPSLDMLDTDFGSGGVLVLPDQPGSYPHLAVAAGKEGTLYFMNEDALGGYSSATNNVLGEYPIGPCWCGESYFVDPTDSVARVVSSGARIVKVWRVQTSTTPSLSPVGSSAQLSGGAQDGGFFTSVSSNGTSNSIIWALSRPSTTDLSVYLYAFDPDSNMVQLFKEAAGTWPNLNGNANLVPVVANGKVFVASHQQLQIFGLKRQASMTSLTSSLNPSNFGQSITLTAAVQSSSGTPTGTATFYDGANTIGAAPLISGSSQFTTAALFSGTHSITAVYSGDGTFDSSTSNNVNQAVNQGGMPTTLISTPNPSIVGQAVTFTAAVAGEYVLPTGTVSLSISLNKNPVVLPLTNGKAVYAYTFNLAGPRTVTASYSGDADNPPSVSAPINQQVNPLTQTSLMSSVNSPSVGQLVTYTATVTGQNGVPTGSVTFTINSNKPVTMPLAGGQAVFPWTFLYAGPHTITASYSGDANNAPSVSSPLNQNVSPQPTQTALTSSLNSSSVGQPVTFTANVTGQYGVVSTGMVTFTISGNKPVTEPVTGGQAVFPWTFVHAGSHSVTASYSGDANTAPSVSAPLSQNVTQQMTQTVLTSSLNPSNLGQAVMFTANVTGQYGVIPTGTVTFNISLNKPATVMIVNGQATYTWTFNLSGARTVTANYSGDSNNQASVSPTLNQGVNP